MDSESQSVLELRRRAPMHFRNRADNARFSAYILWSLRREQVDPFAIALNEDPYPVPMNALVEAYRREIAIALELIVKAVIAQKMEGGAKFTEIKSVPATHNLPELWVQAGLPSLEKGDKHRLHIAKRILMWSGRYPAPNRDKVWFEEEKAMQPYQEYNDVGKGKLFAKMRSFEWGSLDVIYQIAKNEFNSTKAQIYGR